MERKQSTWAKRGAALAAAFWLAAGSAAGQSFVHPGCLSTSADLQRMSNKVAQSAQPWKGSWDILIANSHAQLSWNPSPQPWICRGGACSSMGLSENYMTMARDAAAAYQHALRYHISGNTNHANKSVQIMDAWSATLTNITGDSNWLLAGAGQGYQWACAAELMRNYGPWTNSGGFTTFQNWLLTRFYPGINSFLQVHNGTCDTHYWANWDLFAMCAMISIGIVCDRRDIYDTAVAYYLNGIGNGAASRVVWHRHPGNLGQWQEAGRDQGHAALGPILLGAFCEMAWNQGDDLYSHLSNVLLAGAEHSGKFNVQPLTNEAPYVTYWNCDYVVQSVISTSGRGNTRPGWDLIYNHYVNRIGLAAPYTSLSASQVRPEGGGGNYGSTSGGYDQLGFTTLTHSLDPIPPNAVPPPSGVTADVRNNSVILSWWGSAYADSYRIKRASAPDGPFTTIAFGLPSNNFSYVDVGLMHGTTNYYVVSAVMAGVESDSSPPLAVVPNRRLTGTIIGSSGSYNGAGMTKEHVFDDAPGTFFDAASGNGQWAGLDLGVPNRITEVRYMPRFSNSGRMVGGQFQGANVADFSAGVVTLYTVTGNPPEGTFTAQAIANTNAFRYVRYLSPNSGWGNVAEVQFFGRSNATSPPAAPLGLRARTGNAQVMLEWLPSADTTGFNVKRATASGGPYATVASGVKTPVYFDLGRSNFVTYYYVVSAVNAAGEGPPSGEVSATPTNWGSLVSGGAASDNTGSAPDATEGPGKAFDGTTATKWYSSPAVFPKWLRYDFGAGVQRVVDQYSVSSANDVPARDPSAWFFQASNDGTNWTTLDSRTGQVFSARFETKNYPIANSTPYRHHRLYITTNYDLFTNGTATTTFGAQLSELALQGPKELPPPAPAGLSATPGNGVVLLAWSPAAGAQNYLIKRSSTAGGPYVFNTIGSTPGVAYSDTSVMNGQEYFYVVSAVSSNGEGANSTEASATPVSGGAPPSAPAGLRAQAMSSSRIELSWPAVFGATGYHVKRSDASGGPYDVIAPNVGATSFSDLGLAPSTTWYYVVSAIGAGGEGPNSGQSAATTWIAASTTLTSIAAHDGYIRESSETSNAGGTTYPAANPSRLGDDSSDRQYKAFLSFGTSVLPPSATIVAASVRFRRAGLVGTDPFTTHGTCYADIKGVFGFSGSNSLDSADFQAAADATQVAVMSAPATNGDWSVGILNAAGRSLLDRNSNTQFRLYFTLDDNDDLGNDYINWYTGEDVASNRPALDIAYEWPAPPAAGSPSNRVAGGTASASHDNSAFGEGPEKAFDGTTATKWYTGGGTQPPAWLQYDFGAGNAWAVMRYDISSANDVQGRDPKDWLFQGSTDGITWITLDSRADEVFPARFYTKSYVIANSTSYRFYRLFVTANYGGSGFGVQLSELALWAHAPPAAPTGVIAAGGPARIAVQWDGVTDATGYTVRRAAAQEGPYAVVAFGLANAAFTNTGLSDGATWFYTVSALGPTGESPASLPASATSFTAIEAWRFTHFGSTNNSGDAADFADPDGDGWINAFEFASGTDPLDAASVFKVTDLGVADDDMVVGFPTVSGRMYRVEWTDDLANGPWTIVADDVPGTGGFLHIPHLSAGSSPAGGYRILVR